MASILGLLNFYHNTELCMESNNFTDLPSPVNFIFIDTYV